MSAHSEYIQIRQGTHPGYRFGSDRIYNANSFLFLHAAELVDFTSNGEFHPDVDEAVRREARERVEATKDKRACADDVRTLEEQLATELQRNTALRAEMEKEVQRTADAYTAQHEQQQLLIATHEHLLPLLRLYGEKDDHPVMQAIREYVAKLQPSQDHE